LVVSWGHLLINLPVPLNNADSEELRIAIGKLQKSLEKPKSQDSNSSLSSRIRRLQQQQIQNNYYSSSNKSFWCEESRRMRAGVQVDH